MRTILLSLLGLVVVAEKAGADSPEARARAAFAWTQPLKGSACPCTVGLMCDCTAGVCNCGPGCACRYCAGKDPVPVYQPLTVRYAVPVAGRVGPGPLTRPAREPMRLPARRSVRSGNC